MAEDYNVNIRFSSEEGASSDTSDRAGGGGGGEGSARPVRGEDKEASDRKRVFQQMEWVFRAFRGVPGVGIVGTIGKDITQNAKFSQQALGLSKDIGAGVIAGIAGVVLTLGALLKQSKIATTYSAAFFQIIGAMIDMLLVPYIPLLGKVVDILLKGLEWTSTYGQTIADLLGGIGKVLAGVFTADIDLVLSGAQDIKDSVNAFIDIQRRRDLVAEITEALQAAIEGGAQISNLDAIIAALNTLPTDLLRELRTRRPEEIATAAPALAMPGLTPVQIVRFQDDLRQVFSGLSRRGIKLTPRDLVDLAKVGLLKMKDIFDISTKYNVPAAAVLGVVGTLGLEAAKVLNIESGEKDKISVAAKQLITLTEEKIVKAASDLFEVGTKLRLAEWVDLTAKLPVKDIVNLAIKLAVSDMISDPEKFTLVQDAMKEAGATLINFDTVIDSIMNSTLIPGSKDVSSYMYGAKVFGEDIPKYMKNSKEIALEMADLMKQAYNEMQSLIASERNRIMVANVASIANAKEVKSATTMEVATAGMGGAGSLNAISGIVGAVKSVAGFVGNALTGFWSDISRTNFGQRHTGGMITQDGLYNLQAGEKVVPQYLATKSLNVTNNITIVSGNNQPLMPGILGKSLQASLLEGFDNQLIRSLT